MTAPGSYWHQCGAPSCTCRAKIAPIFNRGRLYTKRHEFCVAELAAAEREITRIASAHRWLSDRGYDLFRPYRNNDRHSWLEFATDRAMLFHPMSLADFIRARAWLEQWPKIRNFNPRGTSYGLKHVAGHTIGYTTNGVFIAAAISAGFRFQLLGSDARFNISTLAWTHEQRKVAA